MRTPTRRKRILTLVTLSLAAAFAWQVYADGAAGAARAERAGLPAAPAVAEDAGSAGPQTARAGEAYGRLPLRFEPNRGQADGRVRFVSRVGDYNLFLTSDEAVFAPHPSRQAIRMRLVGASAQAEAVGVDPLPGVSNYFVGNDRSRWLTDVPGFARVRYRGVYPGVDLVYYGLGDGRLEYDFVVSPGADASRVALAFRGARGVRMDAGGDLLLRAAAGEVRLHKPVAYQEGEGGRRVEVSARYVVEGGRVRFRLGAYDRRLPLVIDPVVNYATFLGGSGDDRGHAVAVDAQGHAYVTGTTSSLNFPVTNGSSNRITSAGHTTAYVSKLSPDGSQLLFSTYFGGTTANGGANAGDISNGVGVDAAGNVYVAGYTDSTDFPR